MKHHPLHVLLLIFSIGLLFSPSSEAADPRMSDILGVWEGDIIQVRQKKGTTLDDNSIVSPFGLFESKAIRKGKFKVEVTKASTPGRIQIGVFSEVGGRLPEKPQITFEKPLSINGTKPGQFVPIFAKVETPTIITHYRFAFGVDFGPLERPFLNLWKIVQPNPNHPLSKNKPGSLVSNDPSTVWLTQTLPPELKNVKWSSDRIPRADLRRAVVAIKTDQGNLGLLDLKSGDDLGVVRLDLYSPSGVRLAAKSDFNIRGSYTFDCESGTEAPETGADLWWHAINGPNYWLEPKNGAQLKLLP